jgi:hypothetical protein
VAREIERSIAGVACSANGGLIVTAAPGAAIHRDLIVKMAARHKLPLRSRDHRADCTDDTHGARRTGLSADVD